MKPLYKIPSGFASAVAFDMDGLMFDTERVYWKAASALLGRRGFEYTKELCDQIMGRPPEYCFKRFIEVFDLKEDWRDLRREDEELFIGFLEEGIVASPGLGELLDELDRLRIPRCVCTSSASRIAEKVLAKGGVRDRFDFVLTSDDVEKGKPDPEIYLKAAERFGVEPSRVLVLEDSVAGTRSAEAAGCPRVAFRADHNRDANFDSADFVVERLDDPNLLAFLQGSVLRRGY